MDHAQTFAAGAQLHQMRQLTQTALHFYGIYESRLELLANSHNTVFRVTLSDGSRYALRIHHHSQQDVAFVQSEMLWLQALSAETSINIPEPIANLAGNFITIVSVKDALRPRICVLLRWVTGRFFRIITPDRAEQVGQLIGRLHQHSMQFEPPSGFYRSRADAIAGFIQRDDNPMMDDAINHVTTLLQEANNRTGSALVLETLGRIKDVYHLLGQDNKIYGLIHADFHQNNYLFYKGQACAIDFGDCGYGYYLYDVAITLNALYDCQDFLAIRDHLIDGYQQVTPFNIDHERFLNIFIALREIQLIVWLIEQRHLSVFRDSWRDSLSQHLSRLHQYITG